MASSNFPNRPFRLEESVWLISQNVAANTSVLRCQLWIRKNSTSPTFSFESSSYTFWINGVQVVADSFTYDFRNSDALLLTTIDVTVAHNSDGSKPSVAIDGYCAAAVLGYTEVHSAIALPTIPRASTGSFAGGASFDCGSTVTINISRASSGFTHDLTWFFGSQSVTIATGVGTSTTWTPPLSMLAQIPAATSGTGAIRIVTKSGSNVVGTTNLSFTLRAPSSVVPEVTSIAAADLNSNVSTIVGAYVQGLSRVRLTVGGVGVYGSTITARQAKLLGSTVASGGEVALTQSGTLAITGSVTDSRGRVGTAPGTITVLGYSPPAVSTYQAQRCSAAGAIQDDGAYLRVDLTATIASLVNGTQRNALTIRAFTRPHGIGAWTARNVITPGGLTYGSWFLVSGGGIFTTTSSWDVRVQIEDRFGVYVAETTVSTITVTLDLNGPNLGVGKVHEQGTLDVAGDVFASGDVRSRGGYALEPVGVVAAFAGAAAPAGWLLCDGSAVSRTTYAALFTAIGATYGAGNGTSTFNLPDLRGRVLTGRDSGQTEFGALGTSGGAKTNTHNHFQSVGADASGGQFYARPGGNAPRSRSGTAVRIAATGTRGTAAYQEDSTYNEEIPILQPYLVLNHIIRAL